MGQCISLHDPTEVPRCCVCSRVAPAQWAQLTVTQKAEWMWKSGQPSCRVCLVQAKIERIKYEKEREVYKAAKEEAYPKPGATLKLRLKRVESGKQWSGTRSFYSVWRPPSSLTQLMAAIRQAQKEDPNQYQGVQRKATGFVPASAPSPLTAAEAAGPADGAAGPAAAALAEYHSACHEQLSKMMEEEGVPEVDEISLGTCSSMRELPSVFEHVELEEGAVQDGAAAAHADLGPAAKSEQRKADWQQRRQLWERHHDMSTRARTRTQQPDVFAGDSAHSMHESEAGAKQAAKVEAAFKAAIADAARITCC